MDYLTTHVSAAMRELLAARAVSREHGVDAPLERIAKRAGAAIGTLYSHFPNRRALLGALLRERNVALFARGDQLADAAAGHALVTWICAVVEHAAAYQGLAGVLVAGVNDEASELHASCVPDGGDRRTPRCQGPATPA